MSIAGDRCDDEYSVIGDKGEIGFIDFEDDKSVCTYDPSDEGNVVVSVPFPIVGQKPQSVFVNEYTAEAITIRNTTSESVELWGIQIYASNPEDSFTLSLMEPSSKGFVGASSLEDRVLQPLKTLTIWLSCKPKDIGLHTCIVHFDVGDEKIERVVFLLAEDTISQSLASNKPYQRGRRRHGQFVLDSYVGGVRPARKTKRAFLYKLPFYDIPKDVREVLENGQIPDAVFRGLSRKNYVNYFKTLLIMEELRLEEDIRAYDIEEATLRSRRRQYLILEVLGLAERRPSLVHGDSVFARIANVDASGTPVYEGCIHRVEADQVYLRFADEFHLHHRDENFYNIRFMYNRVNMRRLYQAVETAETLPSNFLFPSETGMKRHITPNLMVPISSNLNEEQLNAVEMILGCKGGPPYVINGPPGTGKTMTLVEAILQIYKTRGGSRILICASSNSAADHILEKILSEKLIQVRENEIFRLNASARPYEDIKADYMRFCFFDESIFRCPPLQALLRYRIIITTYMSSSLLYAEGVKRGHFSHIILDEAGQASEPETMVPISNLYLKDTVVVLAGDPLQLGPVIFSDEAKKNGLGTSYLERLFESMLYGDGDEGYVTTLRRNYRCHPEILLLPSKLFYSGELISCRETLKSTPWDDLLPNKEFPVLFIGVQGFDEREGDNPSWFNRLEASMVVKFIKKLTARDVSEEDIGVITPYRQQVAKIRTALENSDIIDVKIGSVEQFQGQEREAIIVSTVRSTVKHDEFDRVHYLGFLSNSKRFNVAITRAKSLLVIIGNPHIICKDSYWEQLLWRCVDNKSYEGCSLPERQSFYDDVQGQESYPNLEQECFQVSGQDQEHPWDEQGPDGNWEEEKPVKDGDWEENKPVGDGDWEENKPAGNGDWKENEPVRDGDWEENKPVGVDDWQEDKRVGDVDWQEDKRVEDGDWQEDKPVVDGCHWYDLKPIEDNNNGRDCSWKEDQLVKDEGNIGNCSLEEFKPVKDEDEWSDGWK